MNHALSTQFWLLLALSVITGCGDDGSAPAVLALHYELTSVNNQPVPAFLRGYDFAGQNCRDDVPGGLVIFQEQNYAVHLSVNTRCGNNALQSTLLDNMGSFEYSGSTIRFTPKRGTDELNIRSASVSGETLRMQVEIAGQTAELRFRASNR